MNEEPIENLQDRIDHIEDELKRYKIGLGSVFIQFIIRKAKGDADRTCFQII